MTGRPEPEARRTGSPVRRRSLPSGRCEAVFWRRVDRREVPRILRAAERFDRLRKRAGERNGPLGDIGLSVLRELLRLVDFRTGRLDPAIDTLMARLRRSRSAVVAGLARLRGAGFLSWLRRFEPTENAGRRGPQVRQATNAYRVELPPAAAALAPSVPPPPADFEAARAARAAEIRAYATEDFDAGVAARRAGRRRMNASPPDGLNPPRD